MLGSFLVCFRDFDGIYNLILALALSPPAPLAGGRVDPEIWRMCAMPTHRHIAFRFYSLTLGQGFGAQRAIAAAAEVLPTLVLATLPHSVASYVMGCTSLARQAGIAAALGSRYICTDMGRLKTLLKTVSGSPENPARYIRALLEKFSPNSTLLGAVSLVTAADAGSVPPTSRKPKQRWRTRQPLRQRKH